MLSNGKITIQWIAWFALLTVIHWLVIPEDSVIQPLNNWGQNNIYMYQVYHEEGCIFM